jgi:hypothetical protein
MTGPSCHAGGLLHLAADNARASAEVVWPNHWPVGSVAVADDKQTSPPARSGLDEQSGRWKYDNWCWHGGPAAPGPAVVIDIDGVLSDAAGRQHFIERGNYDWDAFFEACGDDAIIEEIARLIEVLDKQLVIVLLTGRPMRVQPQTLAWLERYGLRWDLLVMRNWGNYLQVTEFKRVVVRQLREHGLDLRLALDDDPSNHAMFVSEGIPCVYIHSGYYE